jgi:hypothetical protein
MSAAISNVAMALVLITLLVSCTFVNFTEGERRKAITLACIDSGGEWDAAWSACKRAAP